eukprot:892695-Rhodomonas_salina.2
MLKLTRAAGDAMLILKEGSRREAETCGGACSVVRNSDYNKHILPRLLPFPKRMRQVPILLTRSLRHPRYSHTIRCYQVLQIDRGSCKLFVWVLSHALSRDPRPVLTTR